jgi:Fic family protein
VSPKYTAPPPWDASSYGELLGRAATGEAKVAIGAADNRKHYLAWDEFRHRPVPQGWKSEQLWNVVQGNRLLASTDLELLRDKAGKPFRLVRSAALEAVLHRIDVRESLWRKLLEVRLQPETSRSEVTYQLMATVEEAHGSSAIEGAVTTKRQARELIRSGREPRNRSERMVLNNFHVLRRFEHWLDSPLTPQLLLDLQAAITDGTLDDPADSGRFRQDDEVAVIDITTGATVHQPPTWRELPQRLERLCEFAGQDAENDEPFVHPVVRATLLHHQLAYDHPFADGNGRTARALFLWSVLRSGYWWFRSLSLSRAINHAKQKYYRSFVNVQAGEGDTTYFVRGQLRYVEQEVERLSDFLTERQRLARWTRERLNLEAALNARQVALVAYALAHPSATFTAMEHAQFHGITQPTAWKDLSRMVSAGLLTEHRPGGRKILYRPSGRLLKLSGEAPQPD